MTITIRWARDPDNEIITIDGKQVLEFVAIMRKDCNQWAIPGGRVKPHEKVIELLLPSRRFFLLLALFWVNTLTPYNIRPLLYVTLLSANTLQVFDAIKREFSTEALATLSKSDEEQKRISQMLTEHFNLGTLP